MLLRIILAAVLAGLVQADYCFVPLSADGSAPVRVCINNETGQATASVLGQEHVEQDIRNSWVVNAAIVVFFMQGGFAMLEAGTVASKNVQNILFKNMLDSCITCLTFYLVGNMLAFGGDQGNQFIGWGVDEVSPDTYPLFFFQWACATTSATIVSGAVAERMRLEAYMAYSVVLTALIYPVVVHWVWADQGWLSMSNPKVLTSGQIGGMIDFAGGGVVHMIGGFSGFVGAVFVGPRFGRFKVERGPEGHPIMYTEHNKLLAALGVIILWFGWYGFNSGFAFSTPGDGAGAALAGKICVVTSISAASGAVTCMIISRQAFRNYNLMLSLNGALAGLVSITAGCAVVDPWAAIPIGAVGALVYFGARLLLHRLKIDDPVDACPIHGVCGLWGLFAAGLFGTHDNVVATYGEVHQGWTRGSQLLCQLTGAVAILVWTLLLSSLAFLVIKYALGLRVSEEIQRSGIDRAKHSAAFSLTPVQQGRTIDSYRGVDSSHRGSFRHGMIIADADASNVPSAPQRTADVQITVS